MAADSGKTEFVRILINAGASIEAKDNVSKRISIFTYICVCVWVCVCGTRGGRGVFFRHTV